MDKPDVEELVVSWLNSIVGSLGYSVSGDKPTNGAAQYITVDRTGGPREAMVLDRAEILIEVHNKDSRLAAKNIATLIADRIIELESYSQNITGARINSVVHLDDTLSQTYRYLVYCDINHRR